MQALQRLVASGVVALERVGVGNQCGQLRLLGFQALDFLGQLAQLSLFVIGKALLFAA